MEGSVDQTLQGKHYRRGVCCILLWREALIQKCLQDILEYDELSEDITSEVLQEAHTNLEGDEDLNDLINQVYEKLGTDMGDIWISFIGMTDPLVQNTYACHAQDASEYLSSTYDMLPGLMAYDNHDYGRWLPDYWAMLSCLPDEQMTFLIHDLTVNDSQ